MSAMLRRSNLFDNTFVHNIVKRNSFHTSPVSNYEPPPFGPPDDPKKVENAIFSSIIIIFPI